jgi:hypothetical protein
MNVFVSVGTGLNQTQEAFVSAIEGRLRGLELLPSTIGRNTFSSDAPLRAVTDLMDRCSGAVVIALERYHFAKGVERRGTDKERPLTVTNLSTSWNQIEAAMAYGRGLPLLVLVDETLQCDGLLEKGNDWYVLRLPVDPTSLNSPEFSGVLKSWHERVAKRAATPASSKSDLGTMSIAQIFGTLKPAQIWALITTSATALAGAFALGAKLIR